MNAIKLLKDDHQKILSLLDDLDATTTRGIKTRVRLLDDISAELSLHTQLEQEFFYPAFRLATDKKEDKTYFWALEEHRTVDELVMPDLLHTDPGSEEFSGRAKVLRKLMSSHIKEEEKIMFPQMRALMTAAQLREMGDKMSKRKTELIAFRQARPLKAAKDAGTQLLRTIASVATSAVPAPHLKVNRPHHAQH